MSPGRATTPNCDCTTWLSGDLSGYWSRRIDQEHRLVYTVEDDQLIVIQARYHY